MLLHSHQFLVDTDGISSICTSWAHSSLCIHVIGLTPEMPYLPALITSGDVMPVWLSERRRQ